jgi:hypothetical protein
LQSAHFQDFPPIFEETISKPKVDMQSIDTWRFPWVLKEEGDEKVISINRDRKKDWSLQVCYLRPMLNLIICNCDWIQLYFTIYLYCEWLDWHGFVCIIVNIVPDEPYHVDINSD